MLSPTFSPFPILHTPRLLLRELTTADLPFVQRLRSNPEVMRYINRPLITTAAEAEAWVALVADYLTQNNGINWAMAFAETPGEALGNIALWRFDKENHRAELGYMLLPEHQNKGIVTEAIAAVVHFGFHTLGLHSIEAQLDPRNEASAAVLRKNGFVQEALFRENHLCDGAFVDSAVYSLLTPLRPQTTVGKKA